MIVAGIDAGSRTTKAVLWDTATRSVRGSMVRVQGVECPGLPRIIFESLLSEHGLVESQVSGVIATGYGRQSVEFASTTVTEITCHAEGVRFLAPDARSIIEIGGQDSKLIRLNGQGHVRDFAMNDRCAAGTGRFLEMVAERLGVRVGDLGALARQSRNAAAISSMCVVFAETEIIGLLAGGCAPADVVSGVQAAIASRVAAMAGRRLEPPVYFTGGVALIPGMDLVLEEVLGHPVTVSPDPMLTGALGAALLASRQPESA